jgi:CheY-like chemotaxis protein
MLAATLGTDIQVYAFSDPLEALSYASEQIPDLLITDFQMPTLNGAELIRRFRAVPDCKQVPAVVVTAYEDSQFRSLALEAGADDFILSPVDHTQFCAQSRRWLAMRHVEQSDSASRLPVAPELVSAIDDPEQSARSQIDMYNHLLENSARGLLLKTQELGRVDAEFQSVLELIRWAAVIVDEDLRVRRFTPEISAIYNLTTQHIGRQLSSIACHLNYNDLAEDFRQVGLTGDGLERHLVHRIDGSPYALRLVPNHYQHASRPGATLIFTRLSMFSDPWKARQTHH